MNQFLRRMVRFSVRRGRVAGVGLLLVAVGLLVPLTSAAPEAQGGVFRIGYLGVAGSGTANGAQLAIDQINAIGGVRAANGGTYQLELVTLDAEPTLDTLPVALESLTEQNIGALLGPDTNALITPDTIQELVDSGVPVLTPATGDALTDVDTSNFIFRTRAPERVMSRAIATVLVEDLGITSIAAVQTEVEFTEALINFEAALSDQDRSLAERIQLPGGSAVLDQVPRLLNANPGAIVMWGQPPDAVTLLAALRDAGWGGVFAFRKAAEAAQSGVLPDDLGEGVLGFDSWSYADPLEASRIFLRDYVVATGEVPGPLAVAAYDAVWYLRSGLIEGGVAPVALQAALIGGSPRTLVQGVFHPIEFANGDLVRIGVVYRQGPHGGSEVIARFDDITRLGVDQAGVTPTPAGPQPTATPAQPVDTPVPTATLEGVWIEVTVDTLNVRTGPGFNFDKQGQIKLGERYRVLGAVSDYSWLVIDFQGGVGWIKTEYTQVLGDINLVSIVQSPPTPTPAATPTPTLPPNPDIVIDTVVLSPTQPIPNKPFTATVTVRNAGGGAAGRFAVAATWEPGAVYTASFVEGLPGGQTAQVQLSGTLTGTGVFQVAVVADLNNDVPELNEGNNTYNLTYRADYPLLANQSNVQLGPGTQWDLFGGTNDLVWDGFNLGMLNGSLIGVLGGVTYDNAHYDLLTPGVVNNAVGLTTDQVLTGAVYGMYIAEARRAVIRIDNRSGDTIWISYRVYNDTP